MAKREDAEQAVEPEAGHEFDAERIVARGQGRDGWLREGKRQVEQDRWQEAGPVPRSRSERLVGAGNRLEEDLAAERRANEAYEALSGAGPGQARAAAEQQQPPKPYQPTGLAAG